MGLFAKLFGLPEKKSVPVSSGATILSDYDQLVGIFSSNVSKAGIEVNVQTALQCSTVLACVRCISNCIAQIPFRLYKQEGRNKKIATRNKLYDLLYAQPNDWQTSYEFRQMIAMHLLLTGNSYVWLNRDRTSGKIIELIPYLPSQISIHRDGWEVVYSLYTQDKRYITIPASDMWHLKWLAYDGVAGLPAIQLAKESIGLSAALESHGSASFKNGVKPSGILTVSHQLNEDQRRMLRETFQSTFSGSENSGKVPVLGADMKWQQISTNNDNAQFIENRKYQVEEICRAFGVAPIMIGYSDKASTYASAEQMFLSHVVYTMGPWYAMIEQSANKSLLTSGERASGYYFKFNVNALLRGATKDRAEYYNMMYNIGALSPNEIRDLEEMNPYEGGDEYRVPLNMENPNQPQSDDNQGEE